MYVRGMGQASTGKRLYQPNLTSWGILGLPCQSTGGQMNPPAASSSNQAQMTLSLAAIGVGLLVLWGVFGEK